MIRTPIYIGILVILLSSCLDFVEDGLETVYEDSDAQLTVQAIGSEGAAENQTVSYSISVDSDFEIKSCVVRTTVEGQNGSGFNVTDTNFDDPFADHNYGTIRPGIKNFKIRYDYIIPKGLNKSRITFTVIDESGKVKEEKVVSVVPSVTFHESIISYSKNETFHDAIASSEGLVYEDIKSNYSNLTSENVDVQKKIDIIFYYDKNNKNSIIASPSSGRIDLELSIENNTFFRKISIPEGTNLSDLTAVEVDQITADANILQDGGNTVNRVKVGDFIAFIADVNAVNSLKKGILKVEGLHPGSVPRYDGLSYVLECSIITQN